LKLANVVVSLFPTFVNLAPFAARVSPFRISGFLVFSFWLPIRFSVFKISGFQDFRISDFGLRLL